MVTGVHVMGSRCHAVPVFQGDLASPDGVRRNCRECLMWHGLSGCRAFSPLVANICHEIHDGLLVSPHMAALGFNDETASTIHGGID